MDSVTVAVAAGLSLGAVAGYRLGVIVMRKVTGSHARKPLVIGLAIAGACGFMIQAIIFGMLAARHLPGGADGAGSASPGVLVLIALGAALVTASGLVIGIFAGAYSGSFIEQVKERARIR